MNYRKRTTSYLFTVKNCPISEKFFKELCKINRRIGTGSCFHRMGRLADRSELGGMYAGNGCVPIPVSDRWDVYISFTSGNYPLLLNKNIRTLIHKAHDLIWDHQQLIQYCNETHKDLFEKIFVVDLPHLDEEIVSVPENQFPKVVLNPNLGQRQEVPFNTNTENMKTNTTWDVTITAQVSTIGSDVTDLQDFMRGLIPSAEVVKYEKVNLHKDLPLVQFTYRNDNRETDRELRVTLMNATFLEGFEGNNFKRFLRSKIVAGAIILVEMPSEAA